MALNENSFRFLTNKELYDAANTAREQYIKRSCPLGIDPEQYVAQCWVEGIFTALVKAGYKITMERQGKVDVYEITSR